MGTMITSNPREETSSGDQENVVMSPADMNSYSSDFKLAYPPYQPLSK